ncbi:hypothetical protein [Solilutibacter silvestris]|uniref:DUF7931 domain-containing protein n=1 Tax=Solilutibacter silvestris TaxID=1645665 RepID=A0A2K1PZH1_9GAMM|nr:hypothetical protein [Lysobacter silvestris]PNS08185.1 hypothetical protein Lysil_2361 [Lysobacter silvestris]
MENTTPSAHRIDGLDAVITAIIDVLRSSVRRTCLFAPQLESRLWNQPAIINGLRTFAISGRERELRILVAEAADLQRDCGALVALHQRLPSALQLRQPLEGDGWPAQHPFLLGDDGSILRLDGAGRLGGDFTPAGFGQGRVVQSRFDAAWERARPMPELRALGI